MARHLFRGFCSFFIALLVLGVTACGNDAETVAEAPKPVVLCSIFSYYDIVRAIGANHIDARILLPTSQSPHEYNPSPSDAKTAAKAKLYIKNGMGLDDRFDKLIEGTGAKIINISKEIPQDLILKTSEVSLDAPAATMATVGGPATTGTAETAVSAGQLLDNPHIWLDPMVQVKAAEIIRDALIQLDPDSRSLFEFNARSYISSLHELDRMYTEAVGTFKTKEFIGFHSAYQYLAHRYGLKQIASIEEIPGTGLSPAQAENVSRLIKEHNIHYIAVETALSGSAARIIEERTGAQTITLQPLESYDSLKDTYVSLMRSNLTALTTAMGGSPAPPHEAPALNLPGQGAPPAK